MPVTVARATPHGYGNEIQECSSIEHYCVASDDDPSVDEPLLTQSQLLSGYSRQVSLAPNHLANANITSFRLRAVAGKITATVTTALPLVQDSAHATAITPYSGQTVVVLFQTHEFETRHGQEGLSGTSWWNPPGTLAEGFRWAIYYGWDAVGGAFCNFGYYSPYGYELVPPIALSLTNAFWVLATRDANAPQQPTVDCHVANAGRTVTMTLPYTFRYSKYTGQWTTRSLPVMHRGEIVENASAFSWVSQDFVVPEEPILGGFDYVQAWPCDAVPEASYDHGVLSPAQATSGGWLVLRPAEINWPPAPPVQAPPIVVPPNPVPTGPHFVDSHLNFVAG